MKESDKMKDKEEIQQSQNDDIGTHSNALPGYIFCKWVFDSIIMAGGQLSTAYKCAGLYAEDIERSNTWSG